MNAQHIKEAVRLLLDAEESATQANQLTARWPDMTVDDAYRVQEALIREKVMGGASVAGQKVGLTSKAMQRSSGINEPDYGRILDTMVFANGSVLRRADYCVPRVEVELAFYLGAPLEGPGVELLDVVRATEYVTPALELIDARVKDPRKIMDTISDNAAGAGLIRGDHFLDIGGIDLKRVGAALYRNGQIEETGLGCGVMGHPALAVAWLANKIAPFGARLEPGQPILSGSFTRPVWVESGDTIHADFGPMGNVAVHFV